MDLALLLYQSHQAFLAAKELTPMIDPTLALLFGSVVAGLASFWCLRPVQPAAKFLV